MNENLKSLALLLAHHDWYYDYSDDYSAWKRGTASLSAISQEKKRLVTEGLATTDEIAELTNKYQPKNI